MSEEVAAADSLLTENARLRADIDGLRAELAQRDAALVAERAARRNAEADNGWWHATVANYVTSATIEDRALLRTALAEATTYPHPGAQLLSELALARAVVAAARTGFGTEEDILRAYAFDPNLLTARIRAYDDAVKAREL